ncbi:hypothetical protein DYB36_013179 [Aphanomyces astaci]|uniref:Peptidase M14 domain-containing protein n=1 Tax=Aphanomyces astaci TaxID=112090 RepID=A0A397EN49_APHAT|nr:hypothetical protein DYB36_013179 [Aphanomyces astaci]RHY85744.1 hypothetical protein DYB31_014059 [Aphanomyces astaci]
MLPPYYTHELPKPCTHYCICLMKTIAILALASVAVTFAASDTAALVQGPDRKLRTDAQVQAFRDNKARECHAQFDGYIETLKAGKYKDSEFFKCFRTSDQIFEYVNKLVEQNPTLLTKEAISTTVQGKTIYAYKLTSGTSKPKSLYFQSLIHAREWSAGSSNLYALSSILDDIANKEQTAAELFNLYFVPIVNIDGYDISWNSNRLQRKNANEVDLNRNWPARFDHPEKDKYPTNETYHGTGALSEPETKGIDEWLKSKSSELAGCVDVHSYGGVVLYPNGDTTEPIGNGDDEKFKVLGAKVAAAAGRNYKGQTGGSFGVAIGAFDDYIYRTYKKPVLTIEMAGNTFVASEWTIPHRGKETFRALNQFAKEVSPHKGNGRIPDEVSPHKGNGGGIVFPNEVSPHKGNGGGIVFPDEVSPHKGNGIVFPNEVSPHKGNGGGIVFPNEVSPHKGNGGDIVFPED